MISAPFYPDADNRSTPLLFYVADLKNNTFQMRCFVDHPNISDIPTYLRLD